MITDDIPADLTYVGGSATLNGATTGVNFAGTLITADYSTDFGPLAPGATITLRFQTTINGAVPIGTTITNTATVTWNTTEMATASVSLAVGGTPGVGAVSGQAWHDFDFDDNPNAGWELQGWTVELLQNGTPLQTTTIDANGAYAFGAIPPNDIGTPYTVAFTAPGATAGSTASLGTTISPFTNGPQRITDVVLASGSVYTDLHLPITPNGVAYDSITQVPVSGATLTLLNAGSGSPVDSTCFDDPDQQRQVTLAGGHYKFDLNLRACDLSRWRRLSARDLGRRLGSRLPGDPARFRRLHRALPGAVVPERCD